MDTRLDPKQRLLSGVMNYIEVRLLDSPCVSLTCLKLSLGADGVQEGQSAWEELYFVLTDSTLLSFKSSRVRAGCCSWPFVFLTRAALRLPSAQAKEPKGIIVTKYSSFTVDESKHPNPARPAVERLC